MYHFRVKIIRRDPPGNPQTDASGSARRTAVGAAAYRSGSRLERFGTHHRTRSAVAAAAYRAGGRLTLIDTFSQPGEAREHVFDYRGKGRQGVVDTAILVPADAPAWVQQLAAEAAKGGDDEMQARQDLWNRVEDRERRYDAQLAREAEIMLPRELSIEQNKALLYAFVQSQFVARGMIADVAFHMETASDGQPQPHAHVMLTMRTLTDDGFGNKERLWNDRALVGEWRKAWADIANDHLEAAGKPRRLDHRRLQDQGITLEPDVSLGPGTHHRARDGRREGKRGLARTPPDHPQYSEEIMEERRALKARNFDKLASDPRFVLDQITRTRATFTEYDIYRFVHRYCAVTNEDDPARFRALVAQVRGSRDLVVLGRDDTGREHFSTVSMVACESDIDQLAGGLADRNRRRQPKQHHFARLNDEQAAAADHVLNGGDLTAIAGYAGTGKTLLLDTVRQELEAEGRRVRGAALAGIAARNLTDQAGIEAQTIASLIHGWNQTDDNGRPTPKNPLQKGDVLVIDEAGMVGARDMRRLLAEAAKVEAKVVLVGDSQQLQAIEAGAAFRTIEERIGAARLEQIQRQRAEWQREASTALAQGDAATALAAYGEHGCLTVADTTDEAKDALIAAWADGHAEDPNQLILAHSNVDVRDLNDRAREALRDRDQLGDDVTVMVKQYRRTEDDELEEVIAARVFADGDRVLFGKNDRELGVQNGSLGTAEHVAEDRFVVRMDDGRVIDFDPREYGHIDTGYAMTVHKRQGATVDKAYVLASQGFDSQLTYVALTRHREEAAVFYARDQFETDDDLVDACQRDRSKSSTLDYDDERQLFLEAAAAYKAERRAARDRSGRGEDGRAGDIRRPVAADQVDEKALARALAAQRAVLQRQEEETRREAEAARARKAPGWELE